jgi:hypothetical protein
MPAKRCSRVRKTLDGTTSHSTKRAKNARQVAGYVRAPAWPAPTKSDHCGGIDRGPLRQAQDRHGPLLYKNKPLFQR